MAKTYSARLGTRISASVDARLRQFALVSRRRINHIIDDVLDQALPSAGDLATLLVRAAAADEEASRDIG